MNAAHYKPKPMKCPARYLDGDVCGWRMAWDQGRERWQCTNPKCPDREFMYGSERDLHDDER